MRADGEGGDQPDEELEWVERDLKARDLGFAGLLLPVAWELVRNYFRAEVRGLERVPLHQPVLFVGNHSGGFGSVDSIVFILAFFDHVGGDYPVYWLAHDLVMRIPGLGDFLRRCGAIRAAKVSALAALRRGASVVVYPGGELELHRPWTARNEIRFFDRKGFLRVALEADVPIVPIVAHGAHSTYLPLTDGEALARALKLDKVLKLKVLPVALALPWGVSVGGVLPHIPVPSKITIEVLDPIDVGDRFGDDVDAAYDHVTGVMQATLDRLAGAE